MRIAIIDSGIDIKHKEFDNGLNLLCSINIFRDRNGEITFNHCVHDSIGHGTSVVAAIRKLFQMQK